MAKSVFFCLECGYESSKWLGKCPACNAWNSFSEEKVSKKEEKFKIVNEVKKIDDVTSENYLRYETNIPELDRTLGGGIVPGSLILLGGDPGIGKSTLLLQIVECLKEKNILYMSGEESESQIKLRANRLSISSNFSIYCENNIDSLDNIIERESFDIIFIDSIQTMYKDDVSSAQGSVSQVREITNHLLKLAKTKNISIIIVGHVTKEGAIAGPRVLEHMVDVVLYFEGDKNLNYRILRVVKNRFGSTNEVGIFEMTDKGLGEIANPSEFLITEREKLVSGSVISCIIEGTRPIFLEIQALLSQTTFGMPRRTAAGIDYNKMVLLIAVIEKKIGLNLSNYDAYLGVSGGIKATEPDIDLAIIASIVSSFKDIPLSNDTIIFGEVSLTGEVRAVKDINKRISEISKLGYKKCIIPKVNLKSIDKKFNMEIVGVSDVEDFYKTIFK